VTYFVVAPHARERGLGRRLHDAAVAALYVRGARAVFGELDDPLVRGEPARKRVARFERWGARVLDVRYVQPSLGEGLSRDRGLVLVAWPPPETKMEPLPAETVQAFYAELVAVTEGTTRDPELTAVLHGIDAHGSAVGFRGGIGAE
jgi:hypothetical protein